MSDEQRIIIEDGNEQPAGDARKAAEDAAEDSAEEPVVDIDLTDDELRVLCKERVCAECPEKADADEQRLRHLAEMENFRKRMTREKEEFCNYAGEKVLADLLPVLDNLELAIQHGGNDEACKNLLIGVDMTKKIFLDALANHGLEPVGEVGEEFNPEIHEAVGKEACEGIAEGSVCTLMQRGYRLKGRVIRPAKVVVAG